MKKDKQTILAYNCTLKDVPADVWEKIVARAKRNDRSINKEIISILRRQK